MTRRETRPVTLRGRVIGGDAPITVQSMTNADTRDAEATIRQIHALEKAGCDIARIAVFDKACAANVRSIVDSVRIPIVADIHFDYRLAIASIENGIHKLRINPGNIGNEQKIAMVCDCLRAHGIPVRIGINLGSLERDIEQKYGHSAEAMVESALHHAAILERHGIHDIVLSLKASDVETTVQAYRLIAQRVRYPLHLGVTEAGLPGVGEIKSAIGIGSLLLDGIGDTLRVSLTGDPVPEIAAGKAILASLGLLEGLHLISCPTCGRCRIDVAAIAREVQALVGQLPVSVTAAVMGCVVNGPGEAKAADVGIAGGDGKGALFRGEHVETVPEDQLAGRLAEEILTIAQERAKFC